MLTLRLQSYFYFLLQSRSFLSGPSFFTVQSSQKNVKKFRITFQYFYQIDFLIILRRKTLLSFTSEKNFACAKNDPNYRQRVKNQS